jgi:hypothetical protein
MYNNIAAKTSKATATPPMTIPAKAPLETDNGEWLKTGAVILFGFRSLSGY